MSIQDSGSYYCTADNGLGKSDKKELVLDVQYAPQVINNYFKEVLFILSKLF